MLPPQFFPCRFPQLNGANKNGELYAKNLTLKVLRMHNSLQAPNVISDRKREATKAQFYLHILVKDRDRNVYQRPQKRPYNKRLL